MCLPTCAGCQMCFDDKLTEAYGEEWWNHDDLQFASEGEQEEGELPF